MIHLIRASLRYASKADWGVVAKELKPIYTAPSEQAALDAFAEFSAKWEAKYPAIVRLWTNAWAEMVPFLSFDIEIRRIVCSTNAIVIRSPLAVFDVYHECVRVGEMRRGSGYLPRSMRQILRRNDACPASPLARLAA